MNDSANADAVMQQPPHEAMPKLGSVVELTISQNRELLEKIASFVRNESLRFANLRLERVTHSFRNLHDCQGITGLIATQQEWFRDIMQDYTELGFRYVELFRPLTTNFQAQAEMIAGEFKTDITEEAERFHRDAEEVSDQSKQDVWPAEEASAQRSSESEAYH